MMRVSSLTRRRCPTIFAALLGLSTLFALPAMSSAQANAPAPTFGKYKAKGFLTDYSKIPTKASENGAYNYRDPNANFGKYNKLLVDRVKIFFKDDSEYKGIDPDELKMLTDYIYQAIEKAVGDAYPMVKEAGPDVLRLRIAVTDLVPNKPEASVTTLVVPFLWVGEAGAGAATSEAGTTPFTGQATIEFEALDSTSSQQLSAYIETKLAKKYKWTEGVTEGVSSYVKAYSKWDYTKKAVDVWAQLLRQRLDEARGKTAKK
jgi:hypothetical protein